MKLIRLVWCEISLVNPCCISSYFPIKPVTMSMLSFEVSFRAWNITEITLTGLLVAKHVFIFCLYIGNIFPIPLTGFLDVHAPRPVILRQLYYSSGISSMSSTALRYLLPSQVNRKALSPCSAPLLSHNVIHF